MQIIWRNEDLFNMSLFTLQQEDRFIAIFNCGNITYERPAQLRKSEGTKAAKVYFISM